MRPFFSSGGGVGATVEAHEAGRQRCRAWLWCGRKKTMAGWVVMVGWAGREAEAQLEGEGKSAGWKKKEWAERPDGSKAEENYF
jgi:hypothetical protein